MPCAPPHDSHQFHLSRVQLDGHRRRHRELDLPLGIAVLRLSLHSSRVDPCRQKRLHDHKPPNPCQKFQSPSLRVSPTPTYAHPVTKQHSGACSCEGLWRNQLLPQISRHLSEVAWKIPSPSVRSKMFFKNSHNNPHSSNKGLLTNKEFTSKAKKDSCNLSINVFNILQTRRI